MTISQILNKTYKKFQDSNIESPLLDAEILLAFVLKKTREFLLTYPDKKLNKLQATKYQLITKKRLDGHPIAYLTGHKEFYGLDFIVNKHTLVPRPETELIVDEALRITHNLPTRQAGMKHATFIDIGTGSGCIIVSLIKSLIIQSKLEIQNSIFFATDISNKALKMARKNAEHHKVDKHIKFLQGHLLEPILKLKIKNLKSKIVICANLPYGWQEWKNNCSMDTIGLKFEPQIALFTKENGLYLYKKLFKQIRNLSKKYNLQITVLSEIDPRQSNDIVILIKKELPNAKYKIKKDLSGKNRLALIKII